MSRSKRTVRDFPREYLDIWNLAVEGKLSLDFGTERGRATNFKQQLYIFRRRLAEESPTIADPFFQVDLRVEVDPATEFVRLIAYVPDWKQQVRAQLAKENFAPRSPQAVLEKAQDTTGALPDALKDLGFTSGKD